MIEQPLAPRGWLADGGFLGEATGPETDRDLLALDPATGNMTDFSVNQGNETHARVSEDGAWVAFAWDVTGTSEVYVLPSSGTGFPQIVSIGGGTDPRWSVDGTELFYRNGNTIMAVPIEATPTFSAGRPEPVFSGPYDFSQESNWDVTPDGRFLMIRPDPRSRQLQVVLNWFAEITKR